MMRIWKYTLPPGEYPKVRIPQGGKVLSFRLLNKVPTIWVYINVNHPEEERKFWFVETGQKMEIDPKYLYFIGTDYYDTPQGPYMAHLYELVPINKGNMPDIGVSS